MPVETIVVPRSRDIGGFEVRRALPAAERRMVGPFVFFDHMGPVDFQAGFPKTVDVRPHPHTYVFRTGNRPGQVLPHSKIHARLLPTRRRAITE